MKVQTLEMVKYIQSLQEKRQTAPASLLNNFIHLKKPDIFSETMKQVWK